MTLALLTLRQRWRTGAVVSRFCFARSILVWMRCPSLVAPREGDGGRMTNITRLFGIETDVLCVVVAVRSVSLRR